MFHELEVVICHIVDHHIEWDHYHIWVVCGEEVVMEEHISGLRDDDIPDVSFEEGVKEEREEVVLEEAVGDAEDKGLVYHNGNPGLSHHIDVEGHIAMKEEGEREDFHRIHHLGLGKKSGFLGTCSIKI
jgi:hypothetical protein